MPSMIISLATIRLYVAQFDVVVGIVLWKKVDILNMYGLKDVYGIEHNTNCISVSFCSCEITFQKVYSSISDTV